jgi:hypothetical protein
LSPISIGDYLYEVSFPEPLVALRGHILQLVAKQRIISTHSDDEIIYTNDDLCKSGSNARRAGNLLTKKDDRIAKVSRWNGRSAALLHSSSVRCDELN